MLRIPHRGADGKKGGLHAVFLEQRVSDFVIAEIAVVKGEAHRFFRERRSLLHKIKDLIKGDCVITAVLQQLHLRLKLFLGQSVLRDMVVEQDGDLYRNSLRLDRV